MIQKKFLNKEQLDKIHESTLRVLSKIGIVFHHEKALEIFKKHGAKVDDKKVYIDEKLLERALSTVQENFVFKGRNKDNNVMVGSSETVFAPSSGPVYIKSQNTRRFVQAEDFINFTKLIESSDVLTAHNANMMEPIDVPNESRDLFRTAVSLKYTLKPIMGFTAGRKSSLESIKLIHEFLGNEEENIMLGVLSTKSPLAYDRSMLEAVFAYGEEEQALMFASCALPGATSPVSISGTLVTCNAEILAGIVLSQLIRPGFPVIYGNTSPSCDLRYVSPAIGAPETGLLTLATSELGRYYSIPTRSGGSLSDSKALDMQAGIESSLTMMSSVISGVSFVLQSCGVLDSFNMISYEKFIIDEEMIKLIKRYSEGFTIDNDHIGYEAIENVGAEGHYLNEMHTMKHFRKEHFKPNLLSKEGFNMWEKDGSKTVVDKASKEVEKRLSEYTSLGLTNRQEKLLNEVTFN
jgi:trimethylamine--corrinoid protein Co-methyltransferase